MVRVQKFLDFLLGFLPTIALKGFHIHSRRVLLAQARCELNLAMDRIIVRDETADEPNDYGRRFCSPGQDARKCAGQACERPRRRRRIRQSMEASTGVQSSVSNEMSVPGKCD